MPWCRWISTRENIQIYIDSKRQNGIKRFTKTSISERNPKPGRIKSWKKQEICNLGANLVDFLWLFDDEIQISLLKISSLKFAPCLTAMLNKPLLKGPCLALWLEISPMSWCPKIIVPSSTIETNIQHHLVVDECIYVQTYTCKNIYRERILYTRRNKHSRTNGSCPKFLSPETVILSQKTNKYFSELSPSPQKNFRHTLSWIMCGTNMWKKQTRKQDLWQGDTSRCLLQQLGPFSDRLLFAPVTARTGLSSETTKKNNTKLVQWCTP